MEQDYQKPYRTPKHPEEEGECSRGDRIGRRQPRVRLLTASSANNNYKSNWRRWWPDWRKLSVSSTNEGSVSTSDCWVPTKNPTKVPTIEAANCEHIQDSRRPCMLPNQPATYASGATKNHPRTSRHKPFNISAHGRVGRDTNRQGGARHWSHGRVDDPPTSTASKTRCAQPRDLQLDRPSRCGAPFTTTKADFERISSH